MIAVLDLTLFFLSKVSINWDRGSAAPNPCHPPHLNSHGWFSHHHHCHTHNLCFYTAARQWLDFLCPVNCTGSLHNASKFYTVSGYIKITRMAKWSHYLWTQVEDVVFFGQLGFVWQQKLQQIDQSWWIKQCICVTNIVYTVTPYNQILHILTMKQKEL